MEVTKKGSDLLISGIKDFELGQTLQCGQCFHFVPLSDGSSYAISANKRLMIAKQDRPDELVLFDTDEKEFNSFWRNYFDFDTDYGFIKQELLKNDDRLKTSIDSMYGVRILNQDFFETLISFIISQNKQIPHIKKIVCDISEQFGEYVGSADGIKFYSFPDIDSMKMITLEQLRELKTGFRAPYILDAIGKISTAVILEEELRKMTTKDCIADLMKIKGVGTKVANCVALFSLEKRDAFPVDVWIKRVMETLYFGKETKKEEIEAFAGTHFGKYGGYAQQYLFYYGRENNIGK